MRLENNRALYDYLISLSEELKRCRALNLSQKVLAASRCASTVPSTEFLGESRIALRGVFEEQDILDGEARRKLRVVLSQIDQAFRERG